MSGVTLPASRRSVSLFLQATELPVENDLRGFRSEKSSIGADGIDGSD
jgi:hypothetical protein